MTGLPHCHSCSALQHALLSGIQHWLLLIQSPYKRQHQLRNVLQIIKFAVNTHLWDYPVLPVGSLRFSNTLSPGSNIPWTVVCVTLEHKLPLTLLAGKKSSKRHPICYSVQNLKQQRIQNRSWQRKLETHTLHYTGLHKKTTVRLLARRHRRFQCLSCIHCTVSQDSDQCWLIYDPWKTLTPSFAGHTISAHTHGSQSLLSSFDTQVSIPTAQHLTRQPCWNSRGGDVSYCIWAHE